MRRIVLPLGSGRAFGPGLALGMMLAALAVAGGWTVAGAQQEAGLTDLGETRRALAEARQQGVVAQRRAEQLEAQAQAAGAAAERSATEAAAAAARIQQAEAGVAAQRATMALIDRQRETLRARLAEKQAPLVRLTAALQRLARRPLLFALFRPGSVQDTMHLRAVLGTMLPEVARRTAGLRGELDRARALRTQAAATVEALRGEQRELGQRRQVLAVLETRQRLAARQSAGVADRETERALALAEQARDLDDLTVALGKAGVLRDELARLDGPVMRPDPAALAGGGAAGGGVGGAASASAVAPPPIDMAAVLPARPRTAFILPVQGRLVAGFGAADGGAVSRGLALAPAAGAQAVAPAPGRIAFAGPYRGFGQIVIIDHGHGWTSLVTGLAQLTAGVGTTVVAGSPLGTAGTGRPVIRFELRQQGQPVNPLDFVRF